MLGIRNLIFPSRHPVLEIRLTNDPEKVETIELLREWAENLDFKDIYNPNLGTISIFENIKLPHEPLCWPFLELKVYDRNKKDAFIEAFAGGCEDCFTTISLIDYAEEILPQGDFIYARAQLQRNQDQLVMLQRQIEPIQFLKSIGAYVEPLNYDNLVDGNSITEGNKTGERMTLGAGLTGNMK